MDKQQLQQYIEDRIKIGQPRYNTGERLLESLTAIIDNMPQQGDNYQELTRDELLTLISDGEVVPGKMYLITNAQAENDGCLVSRVLIHGVSSSSVSVSGVRFMLVPDYVVTGMWHDELSSVSVGDKYIYGARVWVNLNGNVGDVSSDPTKKTFELDSEWEQVTYEVGDNYSVRPFDCKYDIDNDLIVEQQNNGALCFSSKLIYDFIGGNLLDSCDWNQDRITFFSDTKVLIFVNNADLKQCNSVTTQLLANNACENIVDVATYIDKMKYNMADLSSIKDNKCKAIASIKCGNSIIGIPSTVEFYAFVTDDETGYLEFDFNENPMDAGTYVVGCITAKDVSLTKVEANCDGNLTSAISINFGVEIDDPNYTSFASDDVNSSVQINGSGGQRLTEYNRQIIIEFSDRIESGKLWIAYKYV